MFKMKTNSIIFHAILMVLILTVISSISYAGNESGDKTISSNSLKKTVKTLLFQPDFPEGDCAYTGIISASDGKIYFSIGTHNENYSARFFSFNPATGEMKTIAKINEAAGENIKKQISHGKIHTRMFEHKEKIWFATHTSFYENGLPGRNYHGKKSYPGGHFMNYDFKTGKMTDLARIFPNEGIITMTMDTQNEILYGLTWPAAILVSYDIKKDDLRYWGSVQARGEWGHGPDNWQRVCRTLGIDPEGIVYGATVDGRIWKFNYADDRPVTYLDSLDLKRVPFSQSVGVSKKAYYRHHWRSIEWNAKTNSFWGLRNESATLFEFKPSINEVRGVTEFIPDKYQGMADQPQGSQLGFTLGPNNTIFYIGNAPALEIEGREDTGTSLELYTYEIDKRKTTNHGTLISATNDRRVFFAESIVIGSDDHIYTIAWVEVSDPKRAGKIAEARNIGAPAETLGVIYEMLPSTAT